ncbi:hypothetical protein OpiT1DRAFT_05308 [Opitutaceae bacterium TAV1]|nr:hypothetical protein OpiT1DRAFT_05308 [Opitutaceae bacterium TAV1]
MAQSYLAEGLLGGFQQGFDAGTQKKERKKDREQRQREQQADADLRREILQKQMLHDAEQMFARQTFEGEQADKGRMFTSRENLLDRNFRTGERRGGEQFSAGQNALNREQDVATLAARLLHDAGQADKDRALREKLAADAQGWQSDPTNPQNLLRAAQMKKVLADAGLLDEDAGGAPAPQFGTDAEGRAVIGPDGKRYVVKNGTPILVK